MEKYISECDNYGNIVNQFVARKHIMNTKIIKIIHPYCARIRIFQQLCCRFQHRRFHRVQTYFTQRYIGHE